MTTLFKKVLYTGVGVVSTASDRVKKSIEDVTSEISKVTEEAQTEGQKKVDGFTEEVKTRTEDVSSRFRKIVDTVLGQFDLPNRTEAEKLNAKIAELEEAIMAQKKTTTRRVKKAATTAKKTVTKAATKVAAKVEEKA